MSRRLAQNPPPAKPFPEASTAIRASCSAPIGAHSSFDSSSGSRTPVARSHSHPNSDESGVR